MSKMKMCARGIGNLIFLVLILFFTACTGQAMEQDSVRGEIPSALSDQDKERDSVRGEVPSALSDQDKERDSVRSKCPFVLSDQAKWEDYPRDNIFGLEAIAYDVGATETAIILAFSTETPAEYISQKIISDAEFIFGEGFSYKREDYEISKNGKDFFVRFTYDNGSQLTSIGFHKEQEDCEIYLADQIELRYCDERDLTNTKWSTQEFREKEGTWKARMYTSDQSTWGGGIEYGEYTELTVYDDKREHLRPESEKDGVILCAYEYGFDQESRNVFGEVVKDKQMTLAFYVRHEDLDGTIEELNEVTLYQKVGEEYVDITPEDLTLGNTYTAGNTFCATIQSHLLELEMDEAVYRLEVAGCSVDFSIGTITCDVW